MKRIIIGTIVIMAIAATATWNVNLGSQSNNGLSDISLANVEALAQSENNGVLSVEYRKQSQYDPVTNTTIVYQVLICSRSGPVPCAC